MQKFGKILNEVASTVKNIGNTVLVVIKIINEVEKLDKLGKR